MKKKVLSILLAALMVLPALTACSESAQNTDQPANTGTDVQASSDVGAAEETPETEFAAVQTDAPAADIKQPVLRAIV